MGGNPSPHIRKGVWGNVWGGNVWSVYVGSRTPQPGQAGLCGGGIRGRGLHPAPGATLLLVLLLPAPGLNAVTGTNDSPPSLASSAVIGAPFLALCAGSALLLTGAGMIACQIMGLGRGDRGLLILCCPECETS